MKNSWLAASNFERMQQIISAINTLVIDAKLTLVGVEQPIDEAELSQARAELADFLTQFDTLLQKTEKSLDSVVVGDDPRLGELTVQYLAEKRRSSEPSSLYNIPLSELKGLITLEQRDRLPQLIGYLRELRSLLEQHTQADVQDVLGDI
jgi:hypothetical protein